MQLLNRATSVLFSRLAFEFVGVLACVMSSTQAHAELTFFTSRAAWEAEAINRGLPFAEEDFDDFPNGQLGRTIPSFVVGDIQFNSEDPIVRNGKLVPGIGAAVRFGGIFGTIVGPIGGIGMDLDVPNATVNRGLNVQADCPFPEPHPQCGLDFLGRNFVRSERHLDDGFIGVAFESPREATEFIFTVEPGELGLTADNMVVAWFPIPEPSTLGLAAIAALTLGLLRRKRANETRKTTV